MIYYLIVGILLILIALYNEIKGGGEIYLKDLFYIPLAVFLWPFIVLFYLIENWDKPIIKGRKRKIK